MLNFFKSFFDGVISDDAVTINNIVFSKKCDIIYFTHLDTKMEIFFKGDLYNVVVFANYTIKAYQTILPFLLELNIKYYYINAYAIQNYPNDFFDGVENRIYSSYRSNLYLTDLYNAIIMYRDSDYNTPVYKGMYISDHYVKYNNKNKKIKKFEKMCYNWKEPIFRWIFDNDKRPQFEKFLKTYFRYPLNEAEMSLYDNWLRFNKLKELLDSLE